MGSCKEHGRSREFPLHHSSPSLEGFFPFGTRERKGSQLRLGAENVFFAVTKWTLTASGAPKPAREQEREKGRGVGLQIPSKTAVLSGGLLFCPFCFCCGWLACCAVLAFFALVFGPFGARPQPQNAAIYGVVLLLRFRAGLRAVLFGLLFLRPLARARATPCEPSGVGPG